MPNSRRGPKKFGTPPMDSVEVISGPRFTVTVAGNCNRMAPRGSGACGVTVDSGSCASGWVAAAMVGVGAAVESPLEQAGAAATVVAATQPARSRQALVVNNTVVRLDRGPVWSRGRPIFPQVRLIRLRDVEFSVLERLSVDLTNLYIAKPPANVRSVDYVPVAVVVSQEASRAVSGGRVEHVLGDWPTPREAAADVIKGRVLEGLRGLAAGPALLPPSGLVLPHPAV